MITAPLEFVNSLKLGRHVLLCYEEPEWARTLEFRIIENGLLDSERCVYATIEDSPAFIESQMEEYGIDVKGFKKNGLLHVHKVVSPIDNPKRSKALGVEDVIADIQRPFRFVGRLYRLDSKKKVRDNLKTEKHRHDVVDESILFVCSYNIEEMNSELLRQWLPSAIKMHNDVIFAPKTGFGIGISMR